MEYCNDAAYFDDKIVEVSLKYNPTKTVGDTRGTGLTSNFTSRWEVSLRKQEEGGIKFLFQDEVLSD